MDKKRNFGSNKILAGVVVLLAGFLIWSALNTARLKAASVPASFFTTNPFFVVNDAQGFNDITGQKDITKMGRWGHDGKLDIFWSWDEIDPKAQTFDACALFDSTGNGYINYAICAEVSGGGTKTNGLPPKLVPGFPKFYQCDDTLPLNCGSASALTKPASLQVGDLVTLDPTKELTTDTDPWTQDDAYPYDTTVRMQIANTDLPGTLVNVCTYESASPTSAAGDCLANPGGGFLKIIKNTTSGDGTFTFDVFPVPSTNAGGACDPAVADCKSYAVETSGLTGNTGISLGLGQNSVSVSEEDPTPAFTLSTATCQLENGSSTGTFNSNTRSVSGITIVADLVTTCTFTNAKQPAHITVTKQVVNDNGGSATVPNFTLKVGNTTVTSGVLADIPDGSYAITESGPSGYAASFSGDCDSNGNITMFAGQSYVCTITNDDIAPSLTLSKVVVNDNGGSTASTAWTLSAAGATPISGAGGASSGSNFVAGTYTLSESGPDTYTAGSWSCTGGSKSGDQVTLGIGETATCTITNDDDQPKLVVKKHVINNNGGTNVAADFTMTVTGPSASPSSFSGSESGTTVAVNAGSYSVGESGPDGYAGVYSADCSGSIAVGETKTCTVTNDDAAGSLTIIKHVVNDDGGSATAGDWTMHVTAGQPSDNDFAGSESGVTIAIDGGNYSVDETGGPSGYAKTLGADCSGTMTTGGSATCVITNDDIAPTLTIIKQVVNDNGGTAVPGAFSGTIDGVSAVGGNTWAGASTTKTLSSGGNYTVTENEAAGYTVSYSADCSASISVGESKTCTVTNDDVAPSLTLIKFVNNGAINDPAAPATAFTLGTTGGPTNISGAGGVISGPSFKAGTYTLTESGPGGYTAGIWLCNGEGTQSGSQISLGIGQTATCSITNTLNNIPPSITMEKTATPHNLDSNGGTVTFTVTVHNQGGAYDPFTITSLTDTIYGDLTDSADAKPQDNNTCVDAVGTVIPGGGSYSCTWTSFFPPLPTNETLSEHDVVTVVGNDDDNAGASSVGTASDDATVTQALPIVITNGNCETDGFTQIFTQDSAYHLTATNSGQLFYNVSISGIPGETRHLTLELPYPFVTQGEQPIQIYDSVDWVDHCFTNMHGAGSLDNHVFLADYQVDYPAQKTGYPTNANGYSPLKMVKVDFDIKIPDTGFAFARQHLDLGDKGPSVDFNGDGILDDVAYGKNSNEDATDPATGNVLIPEMFVHPFSMWGFACSVEENPNCTDQTPFINGGTSIKNDNQYQKSVGVGGIVLYNAAPVPGMTVQLMSDGELVGSAITDANGLYSIAYKHKGKASDYTVTLVNADQNATVQSGGGTIAGQPASTTKPIELKSGNKVVGVDFYLMPIIPAP